MKKKKVELREFSRTSPQTLQLERDRAGEAAGACTASMGCVLRRNGFCVWQSECVESCVHAGQPLQEDPRKQALLLILRQRFTEREPLEWIDSGCS